MPTNKKKDEEDRGYKWWLRYVIVPLFGGGGITAIIVAVIMRPPTPPPTPTPTANDAQIALGSPAPSDTPSPANTPMPVVPSPSPTCELPQVRIRENVPSQIVAGQIVALTARASGTGLTLTWSAENGEISDPNAEAIIYTAPRSAGNDVISVRADSPCGSIEDSVTLTIKLPPSPTPPAPTPSPPQPADLEASRITPDVFKLKWSWNRSLGKNEYFAVRFWPMDQPDSKHSLVWVTSTQYELSISAYGFAPGQYYWNVAVVLDTEPIGGGDDGTWELIVESQEKKVDIPPVEPTNEPE